MKAILRLVNGLMTTRNTRAGKSPAVVGRAKRGGLRGIRRVLMGSKGRWLAVGLALTLLHIDLAPAVASTELARSRGAEQRRDAARCLTHGASGVVAAVG